MRPIDTRTLHVRAAPIAAFSGESRGHAGRSQAGLRSSHRISAASGGLESPSALVVGRKHLLAGERVARQPDLRRPFARPETPVVSWFAAVSEPRGFAAGARWSRRSTASARATCSTARRARGGTSRRARGRSEGCGRNPSLRPCDRAGRQAGPARGRPRPSARPAGRARAGAGGSTRRARRSEHARGDGRRARAAAIP
jgi:hypothetical protein